MERKSLIFAVTTEPQDPALATAHSGGWTEKFDDLNNLPLTNSLIQTVLQTRAALLPTQCALIGMRAQTITISGNKLLPGGTSSSKILYPGFPSYSVDVPQATLNMSATVSLGPNAIRVPMRGFPDELVAQGELILGRADNLRLQAYQNALIGAALGSVVRDLTQPSYRVMSIAAGVITTDGTVGIAAQDFVRLRRVRDDNDLPIEGAFRVLSTTINTITVDGLGTATRSKPTGTLRKDLLVHRAFNHFENGRISVKKVGAPFEKFRGRRSKARR